MTGTLLVLEVDPYERIAWHMTGERLDVELRITATGDATTTVELSVTGPFVQFISAA